jgi:hypothetical protein
MLSFKHRYHSLRDGKAEFRIEDEAFQLIVEGGKVSVEKLSEMHPSEKEGILSYTVNQAEMVFFGMQNVLNPTDAYQNWLPIPFFVDVPDIF